jgi:Uma2 family endonuclease
MTTVTAPTLTRLLTADEFALLDIDQPAELVRGVVVLMNVPWPRHGEICGQVVYLLRRFLQEHPLGRIVSNDSGVITERDPDTVRGADVAFYSFARVPRGPLGRGYLSVVPELVVEVRSSSDRWVDVHVKVGEYLRAGVTFVCVLDDVGTTAHIFQADEAPRILTAEQELTFPGVLDDFRVPVGQFFVVD